MDCQKSLKKWRIAISGVVFVLLTLALAAPGLTLPIVAPLLMKMQIVPALISYSLLTFVIWLLVTLMFGRVYCSSVCPIGTLQDVAESFRRFSLRHSRYKFGEPTNRIRYIMLAIMIICMMANTGLALLILDPYNVFVSFCHRIFAPIVGKTPVAEALLPIPGFLLAAVLLVATVAASFGRGRAIVCNSICPVGTTLGLVSRFAIFQIDIDTDKCIHCNKCIDVCKSSCIRPATYDVDGSRCVNCFNCLAVCPNDAIRYTNRRKQLAIPMMQKVNSALTPQKPDTAKAISQLKKLKK